MAVLDHLSLFCRDRMTVRSYYNIRAIYYECGFMRSERLIRRFYDSNEIEPYLFRMFLVRSSTYICRYSNSNKSKYLGLHPLTILSLHYFQQFQFLFVFNPYCNQ